MAVMPALLALLFALAVLACASGEPQDGDGDGRPADPEMQLRQCRMVLVFAPTSDDLRLRRQNHQFAGKQGDLDDLQTRIYLVPGRPSEYQPAGAVDAAAAQRIRDRFQISANAFAVVIVGLDGTEKIRSDRPLAWEELQGLLSALSRTGQIGR